MFIAIVRFPPVKSGKDGEFREWFAWSNELLSGMEGFVARRLLKPAGDGGYVSLVEYATKEHFLAVQKTSAHGEAGRRVAPLLEGEPAPEFYEDVT